jgi:hypothetical protein
MDLVSTVAFILRYFFIFSNTHQIACHSVVEEERRQGAKVTN